MSTAEKKKTVVLISLIALLGVSLVYDPARPASTPPDRKVVQASSQSSDPVPLREILAKQPDNFAAVRRNIFEFDDEVSGDDLAVPEPPSPVNITSAAEPLPEVAEIPEVRYLGFYLEKEEGGQRMAALANSGKIWVGRVGDVLGGRYKILRIQPRFVLLELVEDSRILKLTFGSKTGQFVNPENAQ